MFTQFKKQQKFDRQIVALCCVVVLFYVCAQHRGRYLGHRMWCRLGAKEEEEEGMEPLRDFVSDNVVQGGELVAPLLDVAVFDCFSAMCGDEKRDEEKRESTELVCRLSIAQE